MRAALLSIAPGTSADALRTRKRPAFGVLGRCAARSCGAVSQRFRLFAQGLCHASLISSALCSQQRRLSRLQRPAFAPRRCVRVLVRPGFSLGRAWCGSVRFRLAWLSVRRCWLCPRHGHCPGAGLVASSSLPSRSRSACSSLPLGSSPASGFGSASAFFVCARSQSGRLRRHHRALPRDATPTRCQRQPADGFDTQPRPPRAGTAQEHTHQNAVAVACGHGTHAARPRCPSPARCARLFGRACVPALPCGATVRAVYYLWGTAPPPRAPHPSRRSTR